MKIVSSLLPLFLISGLVTSPRSSAATLFADRQSLSASGLFDHEEAVGALSLNPVYNFDFATLGFGKLTFVARRDVLGFDVQSLKSISTAPSAPVVSYDYDAFSSRLGFGPQS